MDRLLASFLLLKWKPINGGNVCLWRSPWARRQWRVYLSWSKHSLVFRRLTVSWTDEPNISFTVTFLLAFFFAYIFYACPSLTLFFVFYSIYLILSTVFSFSLSRSFAFSWCSLADTGLGTESHWSVKNPSGNHEILNSSHTLPLLSSLSLVLSLSLSFPFSMSFLAFSLFTLHFISWNKLQPCISHTGWSLSVF